MEQSLLQVAAGKVLDGEVLAALVDAVVVDVDDGRVAQRRDRRVLARELLLVGHRAVERLADLQRHQPLQRVAARQPDAGPRRAPELTQHGVVGQFRSGAPIGVAPPRGGAAAQPPLAGVQDLAQRASQQLRIEQVAGQVGGGPEPHGLEGGELVAVGGYRDQRRQAALAPQLPQPLEAFDRFPGGGAEARAQQDQVVIAPVDGVEMMGKLLQVEARRIGVGPQRLQVMPQPAALLLVAAGNENPRCHAHAGLRWRLGAVSGKGSTRRRMAGGPVGPEGLRDFTFYARRPS